jgi:hypothetical protein
MPGLVAASGAHAFTLGDRNAPLGRSTWLQRWGATSGVFSGSVDLSKHLGPANSYDAVWAVAAAADYVLVVGPAAGTQPAGGSQVLLNISASSMAVSDSRAFAAHTGVIPTSGSGAIDPAGRLWFLAATWAGAEPHVQVERSICTVDIAASAPAPALCNPSSALSLAWAESLVTGSGSLAGASLTGGGAPDAPGGGNGNNNSTGVLLGFDHGNATRVGNINRLCSFGAGSGGSPAPGAGEEDVLCNFTGTDAAESPYYVAGDGLFAWRGRPNTDTAAAAGGGGGGGGGGGTWLGAFGRRQGDSTGQLRLLSVEVEAGAGAGPGAAAARVTADPRFCDVESLQTKGPPCPRALW